MMTCPWIAAVALIAAPLAGDGGGASSPPTLIEVSRPLPPPRPGVLSTGAYTPTDQEKPFLGKVTEKEPERFTFMRGVGRETAYTPEEKAYSLVGAAGKYAGWFGIVREISPNPRDGGTRLLIEHKYFDGLTDGHLQVVSLFGAGDFSVSLAGAGEEIPRLGLVRVYGEVAIGDDGLPLLTAGYVRVWNWGLFTFMPYGEDRSNPRWISLRQIPAEDAYSSRPAARFYRELLGAPVPPVVATPPAEN